MTRSGSRRSGRKRVPPSEHDRDDGNDWQPKKQRYRRQAVLTNFMTPDPSFDDGVELRRAQRAAGIARCPRLSKLAAVLAAAIASLFTVKRPGDGACFFHSLAVFVSDVDTTRPNVDLAVEAAAVRGAVVNYVVEHKSAYEELIQCTVPYNDEVNKFDNIDQWATYMRKPKTHADEYCFAAAQSLYAINIVLLDGDYDLHLRCVETGLGDPSRTSSAYMTYTGTGAACHFDAVLGAPDATRKCVPADAPTEDESDDVDVITPPASPQPKASAPNLLTVLALAAAATPGNANASATNGTDANGWPTGKTAATSTAPANAVGNAPATTTTTTTATTATAAPTTSTDTTTPNATPPSTAPAKKAKGGCTYVYLRGEKQGQRCGIKGCRANSHRKDCCETVKSAPHAGGCDHDAKPKDGFLDGSCTSEVAIFATFTLSDDHAPHWWFGSLQAWADQLRLINACTQYDLAAERGAKKRLLHYHMWIVLKMLLTAATKAALSRLMRAMLLVGVSQPHKFQFKYETFSARTDEARKMYISKDLGRPHYQWASSHASLEDIRARKDKHDKSIGSEFERSREMVKPFELTKHVGREMYANKNRLPNARWMDLLLWSIQAGEIGLTAAFVTPSAGGLLNSTRLTAYLEMISSPNTLSQTSLAIILFGPDAVMRTQHGQPKHERDYYADPACFEPMYRGLSRSDVLTLDEAAIVHADNRAPETPFSCANMRPRQRFCVDLVSEDEDQHHGRTVIAMHHAKGGEGKTVLGKCLCTHYGATLISGEDRNSGLYHLAQYVKTHGKGPRIVIIDVPRAQVTADGYMKLDYGTHTRLYDVALMGLVLISLVGYTYAPCVRVVNPTKSNKTLTRDRPIACAGMVEIIKNGMFFSTKYVPVEVNAGIPHVILLGNNPPDLAQLSADRWTHKDGTSSVYDWATDARLPAGSLRNAPIPPPTLPPAADSSTSASRSPSPEPSDICLVCDQPTDGDICAACFANMADN